MPITIKQLPELERPYEKLQWHGEEALSNAELLAIIIKTGTKEETSVQVAQKILTLNEAKSEGMNFLRNISLEELMQIKGIGKVKAIQLKAVGELASRMTMPAKLRKMNVKNPQDLANILMEELRFQRTEILKVVILNSKNDIIKIKEVAVGGNHFIEIPIKDILQEPIKMKASKFVLVHNHPTGDATPSQKDLDYTGRLMKAANLVGIQLLDHIVIGDKTYTSIFDQIVKQADTKKVDIKKRKEEKT